MKNLATLAFNQTRKVTKTRAMEIIESLANDDNIEVMAELYSYFKPATPAKPKTSSDWVCKAIAKNEVRYYLQRLDVKSGRMAATDGRRLHICKTDLPDGAYDSQLNLISEESAGRFPDIGRVINKYPRYTQLGNVEVIQHTINSKKNKTSYIDIRIEDINIRFDLKYWSEATCGFTDKAHIHFISSNDNVYIEEGDRKAIIMPVFIK